MSKARTWIVVVLSALMLTASAQTAQIDWRQSEGSTLVVGGIKHAYTAALEKLIPQFEELTGIDVHLEVYSQDEFMNKRLIDLSSGSGIFDIVMLDQAIVQYARAGWVDALEPYFEDPTLVDADAYGMDDYLPAMIGEGRVDGNLYGLPVTAAVQMLFYRKDVLADAGIAVPTTFDELYAAAVELNQPGKMAGILLRGQKIHSAWSSVGFVWSYGGRIMNDPAAPTAATFDSPEAAAGIAMYAKLLRDAGPLGAGNYTWYEALADFQQGKAAMYIDNAPFMGQIEDPKASTVAGKVGYAPMPAGPAGEYANSLAWMLSMSSSSKNKDAATLFLAWATGAQMALEIGQAAGTSARESFYASDWVGEHYPADWAETFVLSTKRANPESGFPRIVEIDEWLDIYGGAVNATILGTGTAQKNLSDAAVAMNRVFR